MKPKKIYFKDSICPECNEECYVVGVDKNGDMWDNFPPGLEVIPVSKCCEYPLQICEIGEPSFW